MRITVASFGLDVLVNPPADDRQQHYRHDDNGRTDGGRHAKANEAKGSHHHDDGT